MKLAAALIGKRLFALFIIPALILATACSGQAVFQATPGGQPETAVLSSPTPASPQAKKAIVPREKAPPAMPRTGATATAILHPTADAGDLHVISYDDVEEPRFYNPPVETLIPTPLPPIACEERLPDPDLFTIISKEYGISKVYAPDDLVPLEDHLPYSVTVGYPSEVREIILQPLVEMISDMLEEGLQPWILSGYRSYAAQAISWDKWNRLYPDTAAIVSAQPGHSEHQLGTVIDFGSPELRGIVGDPDVEFHTYFYKTSEGEWLAENAHNYGFTISFTIEAFETTGFYYEPWHFRYVGKEMAQFLRDQNLTLTEYKLANEPPPCTP
jgi:LAS superfamily LD-carboxypeptidase LdcB